MAALKPQAVNLRTVALPAEHGGWGFLLEPIVLGLLVAPSGWGVLLGIAITAAFLCHQPLKLALKDRQNGVRLPRTKLAERFLLGYGLLAGGGLLLVSLFNPLSFWLPLLVAAPLALIQARYDLQGRSRELLPELAGATALSASASAMALLVGWPLGSALLLWGILLTRALPSIVYVRVKLRQVKGKAPRLLPFWGFQLAVLCGVGLGMLGNLWPLNVGLANLVLGVRAGLSLHIFNQPIKAMWVGIQETLLGVVFVLIVAAGYWLVG